MLTVGGSSGRAPPDQLTAPHHRAPQAASSGPWSTTQGAASLRSSAPCCDRGAAFHVQKLLAQQPERGAPSTAPAVMLAAYHAHLAGRIRYFGPFMPVDLRI